MTSKMCCPFYNVGFCKFKDNCSKKHADEDCPEKMCTNKNCPHRHGRSCKCGKRCKHLDKNIREFLHEPANGENIVMNTEMTKVKNEVKKHIKESSLLKKEIDSLKITISEQKNKLSKFEMDAAIHKQASRELDKLKNQVKVMNISIKEEKEKFAILILKHKEELKDKDASIISLQTKPAESNVPSFNFGGKTHTVPLIEKKNKLKKVKPSSTGKDPFRV